MVVDQHWLEMELSQQLVLWRERGRLAPEDVLVHSMAVLMFAAMVVDVHRHLSPIGQTALVGRLRDCLNSGFAGLYLELDIAQCLLESGFEVMFPDLEGEARFDLQFSRGAIEGEVECKSLSADAGRKIHRRDFYRLVDALAPHTFKSTTVERPVLVMTLSDRLPSDDASQRELCAAAAQAFECPTKPVTNTLCSIRCEAMPAQLVATLAAASGDSYAAFRETYGGNCHVAGGLTEDGGCIVVMRSSREDDHSKPQLQAIKQAASQLSGLRPGLVAIQFEDTKAPDLTRPHLRRRAALFANSLFHDPNDKYTHVAAVYHCAFGGLYNDPNAIAKPAFVGWNPRWKGSLDGMPFRDSIPNSEFARRLGVDPATTDADDHIYGTGL